MFGIGGRDSFGLTVEKAGEDHRSAVGQRRRKAGGEVDQRPGKDIGDQQVEGFQTRQQRVAEPARFEQENAARPLGDGDMVERGVGMSMF